ncbi:2OG-Fe dioxygenase family protein [Rhizobium leguminosarum]|uniref:2OG-Fe dioxygenase family protein n=1 Tax=Rhizobium leguminosarum TaxID=384 RepID=A0A1B1CLD5_RHILE|nr:2OG-Fe dioxygenase family protein [Rhizobium leguminosarum]ANP90574.1 hypothetical protein BA011_32200 [Rhizobium leguminosarum]
MKNILVEFSHHADARADIEARGYTKRPLQLDRDLAYMLARMASGSWDLPADEWYRTGKRYRSFDQYSALVTGTGVEVRHLGEVRPYFQDVSHNPELGGVERRYAPLAADLSTDVGIYKLISQQVARLPLSNAGQAYQVNLHVMRYCALPGQRCETSPPGYHKDGERFISVVLLTYCGADGGRVHIADNEKSELDSFLMREMGENYIIDDESVYHKLSPVEIFENNTFAFRDVLILDFIPLQKTGERRNRPDIKPTENAAVPRGLKLTSD